MDKKLLKKIYSCENIFEKCPKEWLIVFGFLTIFWDGS